MLNNHCKFVNGLKNTSSVWYVCVNQTLSHHKRYKKQVEQLADLIYRYKCHLSVTHKWNLTFEYFRRGNVAVYLGID